MPLFGPRQGHGCRYTATFLTNKEGIKPLSHGRCRYSVASYSSRGSCDPGRAVVRPNEAQPGVEAAPAGSPASQAGYADSTESKPGTATEYWFRKAPSLKESGFSSPEEVAEAWRDQAGHSDTTWTSPLSGSSEVK